MNVQASRADDLRFARKSGTSTCMSDPLMTANTSWGIVTPAIVRRLHPWSQSHQNVPLEQEGNAEIGYGENS